MYQTFDTSLHALPALAPSVPQFPKDVSRFDDGTWLCSSMTLAKLTRCFSAYGFTLNPLCSYDEFRSKFAFIQSAAGLLNMFGDGLMAGEHSPVMLEYLRAVRDGNLADAAELLAFIPLPEAAPVSRGEAVTRPGFAEAL